jgi:prolyl oligopeptidase
MSSSTSTAPGWDVKSNPFPEANRDESAGRTYKSKKEGEVKVSDPYSWLEQPPSQSQMTKEWMEKQVELTNKYIKLNRERRKPLSK